jgi:lipid-A-disaccharide synthase
MYRASARVAQARPDVRFVVSCLEPEHIELARAIARQTHQAAAASGGVIDPQRLEFFAGRTPELIRIADLAWAVSGSVGLELMHEALPSVVLYTIRPRDRILVRIFKRSRFISLVNLIAGEELMPEYLTHEDASIELNRWALRWLDDPRERDAASRRLAELRDRIAKPGASQRAASRIVDFLGYRAPSKIYRGPHDPRRSGRSGPLDDAESSGLTG